MTLFIMCVGKIVAGEIAWDIAPLPVEDEPAEGELQRLIDEAEMTADYEDYLLDVEWLRGGC